VKRLMWRGRPVVIYEGFGIDDLIWLAVLVLYIGMCAFWTGE
jgi:hypothetical protein